MDAAKQIASKIAKTSPLAIRIAKKIVNACAAPNLGEPYICEPDLIERTFLSADAAEGVKAFLDKR